MEGKLLSLSIVRAVTTINALTLSQKSSGVFAMAEVIVPVRESVCVSGVCAFVCGRLVGVCGVAGKSWAPLSRTPLLSPTPHPNVQLLRQMLSPDTAALVAAEHALRDLEGTTVDFAVHLLEVGWLRLNLHAACLSANRAFLSTLQPTHQGLLAPHRVLLFGTLTLCAVYFIAMAHTRTLASACACV